MRFALIDNKLCEAKPGLKGLCQGCSETLIAKCGEQRVHHWSHRTKKTCDKWWERETEWHRAWKNHFPNEWQEKLFVDQETGERHFADVQTSHGLTIEFQHSRIDPQERVIREAVYSNNSNMVWVVDGTRLKEDYPRFLKASEKFRPIIQRHYLVSSPEKCFPSAWVESSVPVIFDFQGTPPADPQNVVRNSLWCLLPGRADGNNVVIAISRQEFVATTFKQPELFSVQELLKVIEEGLLQEKRAQKILQAQQSNIMFERLRLRSQGISRKGWL